MSRRLMQQADVREENAGADTDLDFCIGPFHMKNTGGIRQIFPKILQTALDIHTNLVYYLTIALIQMLVRYGGMTWNTVREPRSICR